MATPKEIVCYTGIHDVKGTTVFWLEAGNALNEYTGLAHKAVGAQLKLLKVPLATRRREGVFIVLNNRRFREDQDEM